MFFPTLWPVIAGACAMLGMIHVVQLRQAAPPRVHLPAAVMGFGLVGVALLEVTLMSTSTPDEYLALSRWLSISVGVVVVAMTWLAAGLLATGPRPILLVITGLWGIHIATSVVVPTGVLFIPPIEILEHTLGSGQVIYGAAGRAHPVRFLADVADLLILVFVSGATWRGWRAGRGPDAVIVAVSVGVFILTAGVHTPLVDAGIISGPYLVAPAFLIVLLALTYRTGIQAAEAPRLRDRINVSESKLATTRERLERVLRASRMAEMMATLVHETAQRLGAVLANAQAAQLHLAADPPRVERAVEVLDHLVGEDARTSEFIERMRSFLQGEPPAREDVDLHELIEQILALLTPELDERRIEIRLARAEEAPVVHGDPVGLGQALANVLLNASEAMASVEPGERERAIDIGIRSGSASVTVEIRDTGPGFPSEVLHSALDPFGHSENGYLGMGLSISKRILDQHGGTIELENTSEGHAAVRLCIPVRRSFGEH